MKTPLLVFFIAVCTIICSCQDKKDDFKIYPLSPFSTNVSLGKGADFDKDIQTEIKTQYYLVDEDVDLTDRTKMRLEDFIRQKLTEDIDDNKAIYFTFYKGSFSFGPNSVQTKEQLETDHAKDKLAEFEYKNGKLYNFDFFKDGTYLKQQPDR